MNILETQATGEIIGALHEALEEQGLTQDIADPRNTETQTVYTNGQVTLVISIEEAA